jgi:glycosyltransferase involved in cell wall biosynthesis
MSDFLPFRDGFAEIAHVGWEELFVGSQQQEPFLTISIPTYRRADLLAEAVRSALAQDFDRPIEIVVVDNDPQSQGHEQLLLDVPEIATANFRYVRNRENVGVYGNHTRSVEVARGKWVTILHDDDLLDPTFAKEMFAQLDADPTIDGLICQMRGLDSRENAHVPSKFRNFLRKRFELLQYGFKDKRVINARKLFWGCIIGNVVGFICRPEDARAVGGFSDKEYPSADYYFFARFAHKFKMVEYRKVLMTYRLAVNVSMNKKTNILALQHGYNLQSAYAGTVLPGFWRRVSPLLMARQIKVTARAWGTDLPPDELGKELGIRIPRDRPVLLYAIRILLRGA